MFIIKAKIVFFGSDERNRSVAKGGGTYTVYSGNAVVVDQSGNSVFCDLKPGFNATVSCVPHVDDVVDVVVSKIDFTMPKGVVEFSDIRLGTKK